MTDSALALPTPARAPDGARWTNGPHEHQANRPRGAAAPTLAARAGRAAIKTDSDPRLASNRIGKMEGTIAVGGRSRLTAGTAEGGSGVAARSAGHGDILGRDRVPRPAHLRRQVVLGHIERRLSLDGSHGLARTPVR